METAEISRLSGSVANTLPNARRPRNWRDLLISDMRKRFTELRSEVGFHDPERFDALEAKFFAWYAEDGLRFIRNCIFFHLDKGRCPVREWLGAEKYPATEIHALFLKASTRLTEKSFRELSALFNRFFIKWENDALFRSAGDHLLTTWINKQGFSPVLRTDAREENGGQRV